MKKARTVSELLNEEIQSQTKQLVEEYNSEKDPEIRLEVQYDISNKTRKIVVLRLSQMTEKEWRSFLREQTKPLREWIGKTSEDILEQRLRRGEFGVREIGLLEVQAELLDKATRLSRSEVVALRKRRTLERLFTLLSLTQIAMMFQTGVAAFDWEPLYRINSLVARRFGADPNWTLAAAILTTHENLVKRKLFDLGLSEGAIENISRKKGFAELIRVLALEIEKKEERKVGLSFYKASALRTVRNRMDHEGYREIVTRDEVFDLLKDSNRFESILYPP